MVNLNIIADTKQHQTFVIIPAAGSGIRMKNDVNKPFLQIDGISVISRTCKIFSQHKKVKGIILLARPDELVKMRKVLNEEINTDKIIDIIPGGDSRQESVYSGLQYLQQYLKTKDQKNIDLRDIVLVHDANRCLVTKKIIDECIEQIVSTRCGAGAAIPVVDTIRVDHKADFNNRNLPARQYLHSMQTPQGADLEILLAAYESAQNDKYQATDELTILEYVGYPIRLTSGDRFNMKITVPGDLEVAIGLLDLQNQLSKDN